MSLSQASNTSTIEDPFMTIEDAEDAEDQPVPSSKDGSGGASSFLEAADKSCRGKKRHQSTTKSPEQECLDIGEAIAREAKRPKTAGKDLDCVIRGMKETMKKIDELYYMAVALRKEHMKSMASVEGLIENQRSTEMSSYVSGKSNVR
ncbi:hypothetical protein DM02DRAFT_664218 [Periconia macrospinosa]|uniref:Uncharacterized protein n=1 Tax=Periconia macrospinosa TaxID=97972 RepID=A0A2V1D1U6_9PLEO|nr:hypothetical protein DM02DRAFT_664218 [Periconia macrospinosa]